MRPRKRWTDDQGRAASRAATDCPKGYAMSTISTMRTNHRLADGSLLRVDIELGRWAGQSLTPDMRVKTQIVGTDVDVHAWADQLVA